MRLPVGILCIAGGTILAAVCVVFATQAEPSDEFVVEGTVTDMKGAPQKGIDVQAFREEGGAEFSIVEEKSRLKTDEEGRYRVVLKAKAYFTFALYYSDTSGVTNMIAGLAGRNQTIHKRMDPESIYAALEATESLRRGVFAMYTSAEGKSPNRQDIVRFFGTDNPLKSAKSLQSRVARSTKLGKKEKTLLLKELDSFQEVIKTIPRD